MPIKNVELDINTIKIRDDLREESDRYYKRLNGIPLIVAVHVVIGVLAYMLLLNCAINSDNYSIGMAVCLLVMVVIIDLILFYMVGTIWINSYHRSGNANKLNSSQYFELMKYAHEDFTYSNASDWLANAPNIECIYPIFSLGYSMTHTDSWTCKLVCNKKSIKIKLFEQTTKKELSLTVNQCSIKEPITENRVCDDLVLCFSDEDEIIVYDKTLLDKSLVAKKFKK